ncbi:hypothetical protein [Bergeyella sp. RCAD1439]|uniref:hypothetical protein n=1 Tax=Bergeyella anatis TaxID=3113737 RepID=UPI002E1980FD|nr:hypothetical protein [Bergeyella sp. RCAD1439]
MENILGGNWQIWIAFFHKLCCKMKKRQLKTFGILGIVLSNLSCDPSHTIKIINNGESDLKVKFEIDSKNEIHALYNIEGRNKDTICYNLKSKDTVKMDFGIGTWSDSEIHDQANAFKSIEFENNDLKKKLKQKKVSKPFLRKIEKVGFWEKLGVRKS